MAPNRKKKSKKKSKKEVAEKQWFERLLPGEWYRGTDANGRGVGVAYMGEGFYLTWSKGTASAFALLAVDKSKKGPPQIKTYRIKEGLKILDNGSDFMCKLKKEEFGVDPWDKISSPLFSKLLTARLQEFGYDGVISSDPANGIVIFDASNVKEITARRNPKETLVEAINQKVDEWLARTKENDPYVNQNEYVYGMEGNAYLRYLYSPIRNVDKLDLANITIKDKFQRKGISKRILAALCEKPIKTIKVELIHNLDWANKVKNYKFPGRKTIVKEEGRKGGAISVIFEKDD